MILCLTPFSIPFGILKQIFTGIGSFKKFELNGNIYLIILTHLSGLQPAFGVIQYRLVDKALREDTHKKSVVFSGRTTERGGDPPPRPLRKKLLFFL